LAPLLIEDLGGWDEVVADEDTLWSWGGAGWERIEDSRARAIVVGYAGRRISRGTTTKALSISHARTAGVLAVARDLRASPGFFAAAPAGVPFRRGFLRLMDDGGLCWEDHAAEQRQRASGVLPFDPEEPGEGCREAWPKFLGATWAGCSDIDIRADLLQEWTGAALFGLAPRFKLSLLLVGPADTGKSTLLSIVESLFPAPSRTAIGLQSMASEYYRATLASSRLNVVNELPARELLDAESAKAILSGDPVEARHPAGRPFVLTCRAGHLFAANELPRTLDRALVRRLAILTCPHAVPVEKQDQRLRGRLLAELPQIAWWAVEGAQRLVRRGHYVLPESAGSAAKEWTTDSDSAAGFAEALLRRSASATSMRTIYARYRTWCEESGHRAMAASELGKRLRGLGFEEGQRRSEGKTLLAEVA
jgi:P4 family phage/plasmid primase-like protien